MVDPIVIVGSWAAGIPWEGPVLTIDTNGMMPQTFQRPQTTMDCFFVLFIVPFLKELLMFFLIKRLSHKLSTVG